MAVLKHAIGEEVSAQKLNGVVDRLPAPVTGFGANVLDLHPSDAAIKPTSAVDKGRLILLGNFLGETSNAYNSGRTALWSVQDPVWSNQITRLAVVTNPTDGNVFGYARTNGQVVAQVSTLIPSKQFLQVDPNNPTKLKSATGGPARFLASAGSGLAVVELGTPQNLWDYELDSELAEGAQQGQATLYELDGTPYGQITLNFPDQRIDCPLPAGTKGRCMQCGNRWEALTTASAMYGEASTEKVKVGNASMTCETGGPYGRHCINQDEVEAKLFGCVDEGGMLPRTNAQLLCFDNKEFMDCLQLCQYICDWCPVYVQMDIECGDNCCEDCEFPNVNPITGLEASIDGPPAASASKSGPSTKITDCTFSVPMDNDTTWVVTYLGDGDWQIQYELGGSGGTIIAAGDCTMATDFTAPDPTLEGSLSAAGEPCEPPPPVECCGNCLIYDVLSISITDATGTINSVGPAMRTDNCCFTLPMSDDTIATACYDSAQFWQVSGTSKATVQGGNCGGGALSDGNQTTGNITVAADVCGGCCALSSQTVLTNFNALDGEVRATQNPPDPVPIMFTEGECSAQFNVPVKIVDEDTLEERQGTATVKLFYDPGANGGAGDCLWAVEISGGNPVIWPTFTAASGCEGTMSCNAADGDCEIFTEGSFDVNDPVNDPMCMDPNAMSVIVARRASREQRLHEIRARNPNNERPGTRLEKSVPKLFMRSGCKCRDVPTLMDGWGCDVSEERMPEIIDMLSDGVARSQIPEVKALTNEQLLALVITAIDEEREAKRPKDDQ